MTRKGRANAIGRLSDRSTFWLAACASSSTNTGTASEIYWQAAKACESRYRTLHLDRIDSDGNASMHADADSRMELPAFITCYREGMRANIEHRRQAGIPIPDTVNQEPSADID